MSQVLAPNRPADMAGLWSLLRAKRTWLGHGGIDAFDPNVWSGRASQEVFVEVAVSGLASMYPASDWSVLCSGPPWISARVRPHERTGLIGPFGSPVLAPPGRPILHLVSSSRRPRR